MGMVLVTDAVECDRVKRETVKAIGLTPEPPYLYVNTVGPHTLTTYHPLVAGRAYRITIEELDDEDLDDEAE